MRDINVFKITGLQRPTICCINIISVAQLLCTIQLTIKRNKLCFPIMYITIVFNKINDHYVRLRRERACYISVFMGIKNNRITSPHWLLFISSISHSNMQGGDIGSEVYCYLNSYNCWIENINIFKRLLLHWRLQIGSCCIKMASDWP